jgi:hypothetical protein
LTKVSEELTASIITAMNLIAVMMETANSSAISVCIYRLHSTISQRAVILITMRVSTLKTAWLKKRF